MSNNVLGQLFPKPFWYPQRLDRAQDLVRMIRMRRSDYFTLPFLDGRGMRPDVQEIPMPWDHICESVPTDARADSHWIFHISHVGSTLLSRLLAELGGVIPLREPLLALSLLDLPKKARAEQMLPVIRLLSRTFVPDERAVVKATSAVGDIAPDIMAATSGRAIALRMSPERHIAARLIGNLDDLRQRGNFRRVRLEHRIGARIDPASIDNPPILAAMSWACEATAHEVLEDRIGKRLLFVDFDDFLAHVPDRLGDIAKHFDLPATPSRIAAVLASTAMTTHAKNQAIAFDRSGRSERLEAALKDHACDISTAMTWLTDLAARSSALDTALARSS